MNKNNISQKGLIIFLLIHIFFANSIFSQIKISNEKDKHYLQFGILESKQNIGKYIVGNIDSLGFKKYQGKKMPHTLPAQNRMLTLRASFVIDSAFEKNELVMVFPPVFYACNIYLNGALIHKRGDIKNGYTSRNHTTECYLLPPGLLNLKMKYNEIAIELLPKYGEKNSVTGIFISNRKLGETYTFWRNIFSIDFIKAMLLSSFIIFLYFIIFSFHRKSEQTSYYIPFSMACLFYPVAYLTNIGSFDFVDTLMIERITRLGTALWSYFTIFYMLEFTKIVKFKNRILTGLAIIYLPIIILGWLQNTVPDVVEFNLRYTSILNIIVVFATIASCFIYTFHNRTKYAYLLASVYLLVIPSLAYDLYYSVILQSKPYAFTLPYVMFLTIMVFFFIVAGQQSAVYKLAAKQAGELKNINENLEKIIIERTIEIRKLSAAVEQSPITIVITDTKGNIEYANPKFIELTGYNIQEALGKNPRILKSGKTDEKLYKELWQTISKGETWKGELINRKKNGDEFIENTTIAPITDLNGKIISFVAIKEDITERKRQEEIIELSNIKLSELNVTKDKFFNIIAHDLRGPICAVDSLLDFLLEEEEEETNKRGDFLTSLNMLKTSTQQIYSLLESLLTWARLQKDEIIYNPSTHNISNIIKDNIGIFQLKVQEKKISLINNVKQDVYCFFDYQMINTVIRNLINNATKYTNVEGEIEISLIEKEHTIEISIKDSGIGITKSMLEKLFRIDSKQISQPGTIGETGTGLGLILCKDFIEKNHGEIWVESEVGKGSEFKFTLPISI